MSIDSRFIERNLLAVLAEVQQQVEVAKNFPPELQEFSEQTEQIHEWIETAGEYGIAYESLITMLEEFPFVLTGQAAVKLLEAGLLMRFKTEQPRDAQFDSRSPSWP